MSKKMSKLVSAILCLAKLQELKEAVIALAEMSTSTVDEDLAQLKKERQEFLELAKAKEPGHFDLCLLWRYKDDKFFTGAEDDAIAFLEGAMYEDTEERGLKEPWCFAASPFAGCYTCMAIDYYLSP
jgi:hypothetical protein